MICDTVFWLRFWTLVGGTKVVVAEKGEPR
jgi:hypothetical protein